MISFQFSQVVEGVSVSLGVEVSAETVASAFQGEESPGLSLSAPGEATEALREALQLEAVRRLNEVTGVIQLLLLRRALDLLEAERES
jgi:hypothetical protein